MADDRTYIRVHDGLDEHPKVEGLSDGAFRLLLTGWFYCSRNRTDGRITAASWKKRGTPKARRELVAAGLVDDYGDYVEMHDYLEHQRSAQEIRLLQETRGDSGSFGNHVRWHVVKRKPKQGCEHCFPEPSEGIANAIANGSQTESQTDRKPIASTEAEAEAEVSSDYLRGGSHVPNASDTRTPPQFPDHCIEHANEEVPPKCGGCAKQKAANKRRAEALPDYRMRVIKPLCGECDERWIETPDGLAKCPNCYPTEARSA